MTGVGEGIAGFSLSLVLWLWALSASLVVTVSLSVLRGGRVRRGRLGGRTGRAAPPIDDRGPVDDEAAVIGGCQASRGSRDSRPTSAPNTSLMSQGGD